MGELRTNTTKGKSFAVCFMLGEDHKNFRKTVRVLNSTHQKVGWKHEDPYEIVTIIEGYEKEWEDLFNRYSEMAEEKVSTGVFLLPRVSLILRDHQ